MLTTSIARVSDRLSNFVSKTPLRSSDDPNVLVKCENVQVTGSFKIRGAFNALLELHGKHVVTASSGNFGKAVAYAGRALGFDQVTVFASIDAIEEKKEAVRRLGADVVETNGFTFEALDAACAFVLADGDASFVSSYDDIDVIRGQATVAWEILRECPDVSTIVVPVGGGGLLAGTCLAVRESRRDVKIVGAEPAGGIDTILSLRLGGRVSIPAPITICDGARTQTPGATAYEIFKQQVTEIHEVEESDVVDSMRRLARHGIDVEPTGALAYAVATKLDGGAGKIVAVASGGNIGDARRALILEDHAVATDY